MGTLNGLGEKRFNFTGRNILEASKLCITHPVKSLGLSSGSSEENNRSNLGKNYFQFFQLLQYCRLIR
jgi:hypothetical protein